MIDYLNYDDFPLVVYELRILSARGVPLATCESTALAADIAFRLNLNPINNVVHTPHYSILTGNTASIAEASEFVRRVQSQNGGPNAKIDEMRKRYDEVNRAKLLNSLNSDDDV